MTGRNRTTGGLVPTTLRPWQSRIPVVLVATVAGVLVLLLWFLLAWKAHDDRAAARADQLHELQSLARGLAAELEMMLVLSDEALIDLGEAREVAALGTPEFRRAAGRRFLRSAFLNGMAVLGAEGRERIGFGRPPTGLAHQPWFQTFRTGDASEAIGALNRDLVLARRLPGDDQTIGLALVDTTPMRAAIGSDVLVLVVDADDRVVQVLGAPAGAVPADLAVLTDGDLTGFRGQGLRLITTPSHFIASEQLASWPLRLVLAAPRVRGLAAWRREVWLKAAFAGGVTLILGALLWTWIRTVRRQQEASHDLFRLYQAIDQIPASFVITDPQANIVFTNPAFTETTGYDRAEVLGRNPRLLQSGQTPLETYDRMWAELKAGRSWRGELINRRKDGSIYWEDAVLAPLRDHKGRVVNYVAVKTDITRLKNYESELQAASERFRALSESSPVGVFQVDAEGRTRYVNRRWLAMSGLDRAPALEQGWQSALHPDDRESCAAAWDQGVTGGQGIEHECRLRAVDGTIRDVVIRSAPQQDGTGRGIGWVGTVSDITQRRALEQDLARRSEALERSNADLQQFAYVASHDLQEPLRTISSFLALLERRHQAQLPDEAREFIGFARDGAERLQRLIQDLLQFSRLETRAAEPVPVAAGPAVDDAIANLGSAIAEAEARIEVADLPVVRADPGRLRSLFQNLIGNAIKYRADDRAPVIRVDAETADGWATFAVTDNGIGIAADQLERVFVIFRRLHGAGKYPGTGIGLAVCKRIVEGHGGRIWAESTLDQGTTIRFTWPLAEDAPPD